MSPKKVCIECGRPLMGRSDKKFCDDTCRSNHHNKVDQTTRNLVRNINYQLRKNRKVLEVLNPNGKSRVKKMTLLKKGFDFTYFTSIYTTKAGKTYYFVYEQGYLPLDNDEYALVIKKEYID